MNSKDLILKALSFTSANFDGEVAAMMLGIDMPTDKQVDKLEDAFAKLYRQIEEETVGIVVYGGGAFRKHDHDYLRMEASDDNSPTIP